MPSRRSSLALALLLSAACGGTPTGPAGAPNLSGVWEGTALVVSGDRRSIGMTFNLTQAPGSASIEGTVVQTLDGARFVETITAGTQSGLSLTLQTVYTDPFGRTVAYTHNGTVDAPGTEINGGTLLPPSTSPVATFTLRRAR